MIYSSLASSRLGLGLIALTVAGMAVSACSTSAGSGTSPISNRTTLKTTAYTWSYTTVAPVSDDHTEVTGINNGTPPEIVGIYFTGSPALYNSFTSPEANYNTFSYASFPYSQATPSSSCTGTQMRGITTPASGSNPVLAGSVCEPGQEGGNWAVLNNQGLWSLVKPDGSPDGTCVYGFLFGINDSNVAVGYHQRTGVPKNCKVAYSPTAFEVVPPQTFTDVPFPSSGYATPSIAYGINDSGDMVGTATINGASQGWYAVCQPASAPCWNSSSPTAYCFNKLNVPNSTNTTPYAISNAVDDNATKLIVGSYQTSAGHTHGFLVPITDSATCPYGTFQAPIDEDPSDSLTVISGINNNNYIVGWYVGSAGKTKGFVGTPTGSTKQHHGASKSKPGSGTRPVLSSASRSRTRFW